MKKIFYAIGVLGAVFIIFFFLLVADKEVFYNYETLYTFETDREVSISELYDAARASHVTVQLWTDGKISFGEVHRTILFINPTDRVDEGVQPSVFPGFRIVYHVWNKGDGEKETTTFIVQEDDEKKIENFETALKKKGYSSSSGGDSLVQGPADPVIRMGPVIVFNEQNLRFLFAIFMLGLFGSAMYCFSRIKEIGVLKLNGISDIRILWKYISLIARATLMPLLIVTGVFTVYILISDSKMLQEYLSLLIWIVALVLVMFAIASLFSAILVKKINIVSAVKNLKYNRQTFFVLLMVKALITVMIISSASRLMINIVDTRDTIRSAGRMEKHDLYYILTSGRITDDTTNSLNKIMNELPDSEVYNYRYPNHMYRYSEIKDGDISGSDNSDNILHISAGCIGFLQVQDADGKVLTEDMTGDNTLLIPEDRRTQKDELVRNSRLKNPKIIWIRGSQMLGDLTRSGYYTYDAAICIEPMVKEISLSDGTVFLSKDAADSIRRQLNLMKISKQTLSVVSQNDDYSLIVSNAEVEVVSGIILLLINGVTYYVAAYAMIVIFLELRKKNLAVYAINGRSPVRYISGFIGLSSVIIVAFSVIIDIRLMALAIIEAGIYLVVINRYMNEKVVDCLKGR